jgi:hypothetical protein
MISIGLALRSFTAIRGFVGSEITGGLPSRSAVGQRCGLRLAWVGFWAAGPDHRFMLRKMVYSYSIGGEL